MKETPPVLTAGSAAWIRDRGRKRSRLLGTRPSRDAGGREVPGPTRAKPTRRAPLARSALPELGQKRVVSSPSACGLGSLLQPRGPWRSSGSRSPFPARGGGLAEGGARIRHPSHLRLCVQLSCGRLHYSSWHTEPHFVSSAARKLTNGNI